jgi:hypothetical protein
MKPEQTFANYRILLGLLKDAGYTFRTHRDYVINGVPSGEKTLLLRHDVDFDREMRMTLRLIEEEKRVGVVSSTFVRLHDPYYNALGYRELHTMVKILDYGSEIGLHAETLDLSVALERKWTEHELLRRDLDILRAALDYDIVGVAPHGDLTAYNNQDILDSTDLSQFGLAYHAYQQVRGLFTGWYISNFAGNDWKRYVNGKLAESATHDFLTYARMVAEEQPPLVTFLVHPHRWFDIHYLVE